MGAWKRTWRKSYIVRDTFQIYQMEEKWKTDHYVTQSVTGHVKDSTRWRTRNSGCWIEETAEHVLMDSIESIKRNENDSGNSSGDKGRVVG